jgi:hypothetical protein
MKNHLLEDVLPMALCFLIAMNEVCPVAIAQTAPARIDVVVMAGDGITTNIRTRVTRDPVVKIEDDDHRPVDGAAVVFALPVSGTSGEFSGGAKTLTVVTAKDGLATAHGLKTNEIPGQLQIYVMASYQGLRARGLINQIVEVAPGTPVVAPQVRSSKSGGKLKWVLLGIAAAGGAGAAIYFTRHSSSSAANTTSLTISPGPVVFGNP